MSDGSLERSRRVGARRAARRGAAGATVPGAAYVLGERELLVGVLPAVLTRVLSTVAGITGLLVLAMSVVILVTTVRSDSEDYGAHGFAVILGSFVGAVGLLALVGGVVGWILARRTAGLLAALFGVAAGGGLLLLVGMFVLVGATSV